MDFQSVATLAISGLLMSVSEVPSGVRSDLEIRIGVSSCLLGHPVRYDGAHKQDRNVSDVLGRVFNLIAICPEVEAGMPVPREAMDLLQDNTGRIRVVGRQSGSDRTAMLQSFSEKRVNELERLSLSGYILKKGSPSCGMHNVPVHAEFGDDSASLTSTSAPMSAPGPTLKSTPGSTPGRGLFAEVLLNLMPSLPVEEEDRLNDPGLRDTFIARVRAYHRTRHRVYDRVTPNNHI